MRLARMPGPGGAVVSDRALIRERLPFADVVEAFDIAVVGSDSKISCPFHEDDTASFHVYEDSGHCYGCGWDGDVVWFVSQLTGRSPAAAVRRLMIAFDKDLDGLDEDDLDLRPVRAVREPKPVVDMAPLLEEKRAAWSPQHDQYAAGRWGLGIPAIERWGVVPIVGGFAAPHVHGGIVTGIKYRDLGGGKTSEPGSNFTAGLYNQGWGVSTAGSIVVTEGESDAWALSYAIKHLPPGSFIADVVALPSGAQTWKRDWVKDWARSRRIMLGFDNDEAGRKAYLDVLSDLTKAGFYEVHRLEHPEKDLAASLKAGWRPQL
jgi:hypothetical protein